MHRQYTTMPPVSSKLTCIQLTANQNTRPNSISTYGHRGRDRMVVRLIYNYLC